MPNPPNSGGPPAPVDHHRLELSSQLDRICESDAFRDSLRCQEFLRHVVTLWMDGSTESLKERLIGASLFGRSPLYNTADDSIVRVRAREVRRRLEDYYRAEGATEPNRILLPRGCYVPVVLPAGMDSTATVQDLHTSKGESDPLPENPQIIPHATPTISFWRWPWVAMAAVSLVAIISGVATVGWKWGRWGSPVERQTPLERLWRPLLDSTSPVVVDVGMSSSYFVSNRLAPELLARSHKGGASPTGSLTVQPGEVELLDHEIVTMGTLRASIWITGYLAEHRKPYDLRLGADLTPSELQHSSIIYVGAFSNPWTLDSTRGLRYHFARSNSPDRATNAFITDARNPEKRWTAPLYPLPTNIDYALITRIAGHTNSIYFGGLSHHGTQAAAQFLTDPKAFELLTSRLPVGWQDKDLQILLETSVVNKTPKPAKVLDVYVP